MSGWKTRAYDVTLSSGSVRSVYAISAAYAVKRVQHHLDRTAPTLTAVSAIPFKSRDRVGDA